jgi:diadenosine tetraphosphate (Ap4A) HIT family hydrolase
MCEFCTEFSKDSGGRNSRIILDRDGFAVLPTVGCFVDGYVLIVPRDHAASLASLPAAARSAALDLAEEVRGQLQNVYGQYVLSEHGALNCDDTGAACCDHCHVHLIPMGELTSKVVEYYWKTGGQPEYCGGPAGFESYTARSYVMVSTEPGRYSLWPADRFERQFVRKVCAGLLGKGDLFNWREHPFTAAMKRTKQACDRLLAAKPEQAIA